MASVWGTPALSSAITIQRLQPLIFTSSRSLAAVMGIFGFWFPSGLAISIAFHVVLATLTWIST